MSWLSGWDKRKEITLTGGASGAQTDFQLSLAVTYDSDMLSDFDDLRFTQSDGATLIDAWCEVKVDDTSATVWVEFPTTPANTVEQTYYMYYGKADAVSDWDGDATFEFFDDFPGDAINEDKWTVLGTPPVISDSIAHLSVANSTIRSAAFSTSTSAFAIRSCAKFVAEYAGFGFNDTLSAARALFMWWLAAPGRTLTYSDGWSGDNLFTAYEYHNFDIIYNPLVNIIFKVDDSTINTDSNGDPLDERVEYFIGDGATSLYADWVIVRKYAASPPTYEFESEESAPSGNPFWYYAMLKRRN